ncbi:MAG TPA: hypothetical protein PKN44_06175 [Bacteroidales bacterium]|nr:hypothetical protein [Bacteroidales bacterium]
MKRLTAAMVVLLFGTATPASAIQDGLWYLAGAMNINKNSRLFFRISFIILVLHLVSCKKDETDTGPVPPSLKVWLHRVNTIDKAKKFEYAYSGFELDVQFDTATSTFLVKHDLTDTTHLDFTTWLSAISSPGRLGYWLDFKNLSVGNAQASLTVLLQLRKTFNLTQYPIVIESTNPSCLPPFDTLNFRISYYIPAFDPSTLTKEEEQYYRSFIETAVMESGSKTISGYYFQHDYMKKWFPGMNKLLWYLDSYQTSARDSIISITSKDPMVEILLVAEDYQDGCCFSNAR